MHRRVFSESKFETASGKPYSKQGQDDSIAPAQW